MTRIGFMIHNTWDDRGLVGVARRLEAAGFDSLWSGDHVLADVDGLVACGVIGAATERVQIGTCVYLAGLRPAPVVGRMLSTIQYSGFADRFVFGVGIGGEIPAEFEILGLDVHHRARLLDTCIDGIKELFASAEYEPPSALPPIWVGGRSTAAVRRAERIGNGFAPYLVTVKQLRGLLGDLTAHPTPTFPIATVKLIAIDTPHTSGRELAHRARPFGMPQELIDKHVITGSLEHCRDVVASYFEAGATDVILNSAVPADGKWEQIDMISTHLLPFWHGDRGSAATAKTSQAGY
jgi:alkanesulfonate monooxygenase SsuD/methylene tetrahydromethanopterin reductase-like flavin-dependent oxidoreductase (luciferase family)